MLPVVIVHRRRPKRCVRTGEALLALAQQPLHVLRELFQTLDARDQNLLQNALFLFALGFFADVGALWVIVLKGLLPQVLLTLLAALVLIKATAGLQRRFAPRLKVPGLRQLDRRYGS